MLDQKTSSVRILWGRGLYLKRLLVKYFRVVLERTYFLPQCTFQVLPCYRSALTCTLTCCTPVDVTPLVSYLNLEIATRCLWKLLGKNTKHPVYFSGCSLLQKRIDMYIDLLYTSGCHTTLILLEHRNCNHVFVEASRQKHKIPLRGKKSFFQCHWFIIMWF